MSVAYLREAVRSGDSEKLIRFVRLRARMEAHFKECKHCVAVLDGTRNIVQLVGDEKTFDVPSGFSARLYRKIPKKSH